MATVTKADDDKRKADLNQELEIVLKAAVSSLKSSRDVISSEITQNLCNIIEAIFIHGLRDPFFLKGSRYAKYPEPNFWPFVSKFCHPRISTQIIALRQIRSEIGRGRAWVRIVLNEGAMEDYICLLRRETTDMTRFYHENAFLRDTEHIERMKGYLKGMLTRCAIVAPTNSALLNSWTPTPLILAGLVKGKPIRVGQLAPRRKLASMCEHEEVGTSALELLPGGPPSPIRGHRRNHDDDNDDACSVYSHPSMLDGRNGKQDHHRYGPLSSTPLSPGPLEERPLVVPDSEPLLISRRTTRPRKMSNLRSASDSGSNRSRCDSESGMVDSLPRSFVIDSPLASFTIGTPVNSHMRQTDTIDSGLEDLSKDQNISKSELEPEASQDSQEENDEKQIIIEERENKEEPHKEQNSPTESIPPEDPSNCSECEYAKTVVNDSHLDSSQSDSTFDCSANQSHDVILDTIKEGPNISMDSAPTGNSLAGRAWSIPKAESSSDCAGTSYGILSSSADTDISGAVFSFDGAVRKAMELNQQNEMETSVITSPEDPEMFARSFDHNDTQTDVEVAHSTLGETADESSLREIERSTDSEKVKSGFDITVQLLTTVPVEKGLDVQKFRCKGCGKSIGAGFGTWNVCAVSGEYFCNDCFSPDSRPVPSRVLLSWDHQPRRISLQAKEFLNKVADKPLIRLDVYNPTIYEHISEMEKTKSLREQLQNASLYLFSCRDRIAEDLRRRVWPNEYLLTDLHLYSVQDLLNVHSGVMERHLTTLLRFATNHVLSCALCRQKGFVCELCEVPEVIYPFQLDTHRCSVCFSVYHRACAEKKPCPKCARRQQYIINQTEDEKDHLQFD